jgi:hypothetical protein
VTDPPLEPDPTPLTDDEVKRLRDNRCSHCGGAHARACPRVKRMAYHPNGTLAEVEFWPSDQWSDAFVVFPDEIVPDEP